MKAKIIDRILEDIRALTIRKKLLISYFILIFVPLIILTTVSYVTVSSGYENQIRYSADQSFNQAYRFLSYKINSLIKSSDIVYFDSNVQTVLSRNKEEYVNDIIQQNIDMMAIDNFLYSFRNTEDVYRVCLYVPDWVMYSNQDINFCNIDSLINTAEYKRLISSNDKVLWTPPEVIKDENDFSKSIKAISLLRRIRNTNKIEDTIGVVKVSILESNVIDIIKKANITRNGVVYIQNSQGDLICASNTENLEKLGLNKEVKNSLLNSDINWETMKIGKDRFTVNTKQIANTDWTMITAIPYSEILSQSNNIRNLMIGLVFIIGLIAYSIANLISSSTTNRLSLLMEKMIRVQEGDLDVSVSSKYHDEIGQLMNSFNYMIKRVNLLVQEQYKTGKEIKNAELKALQAQINPHFLYNTLDLINWKAIDNDVPEIAEISQTLAKFYKLSLSKGKDFISIQDEIKHVETYIQIQNLRFDNKINFISEVSEDIMEYKIMKIVLQPIVENSILHGILENRNRQEGTIKLTGNFEKDDILITVQDDGVGMTEDRLKEILMIDSTGESHGYGVRNINKRIKLCYGQVYGLTYYSSLNKGTIVEIRIPAIKEN